MEKVVLVIFGQHKRLISFSTPITSPLTTFNAKVLKQAIQDEFADILKPGQEFFLQQKNEEWGEFLDLKGNERIADKSTVKAVIVETPPRIAQCGVESAPSWTTQSMAAYPGQVQRTERANNSAVKLVLVGEMCVGKSNLLLRFTKDEFQKNSVATIGVAFTMKTVSYDNTEVELDIWDTAGQERYRSLAPVYYRGAQAAVVVYDITNKNTFTQARTWVNKLRTLASPDIVIALAGNKADLEAQRMVNTKEAKAYAEENDLLFLETSAKADMNVEELFRAIVKKLPKTAVTQQGVKMGGGNLRVQGAETQPEKTKKKCWKSS